MKLARLLCAFAVGALLAAVACGGKGASPDGGAGAGGTGGAPSTTPCTPVPTVGAPCEPFECVYSTGCNCGSVFRCSNGKVVSFFVDACLPCDGFAGSGGGGGTGGSGGVGGVGGAASGGASGSGGAPATLTSCPTNQPMVAMSCTGAFTCNYDFCLCGGCCTITYECTNEILDYARHTDDCMRACDAGSD